MRPGWTAPFLLLMCVLLPAMAARAATPALDGWRPAFARTAPVLDGVLDDPCWADGPAATGFKTFYPDYGQDPSAATVVHMAYDRDNLYFAFHCLEDEPGRIKSSVTSRDNIYSDDWVCLNIDTFGDQQSLYAFYVNPAGIQGDGRYTAGEEDRSIDLVWHSAGRIDQDGYTVEMAIPLKSIRFPGSDPVTMAVFFERYVSRRSEHLACPPMDPAQGMAFLTQMAPLEYAGLRRARLLELLPSVTYLQTHERREGVMRPAETRRELSLTGKYGLTSDLILDATVNPDFSQVEADAGQVDVNLRYDLYFEEKRPFFLEGRENFKLAGTAVSELDPLRSVVYTRRIVDPEVGIKLAGKLGPRTTIASLYASDALPDGAPEGDRAHFPILRLKHALGGDSFLGGVYTGREVDGGHNRVGGLDAQIRVSRAGTLELSGLHSSTRADGGSAATGGHALAARYLSDDRDWTLAVAAREVSRGFATEAGYLTRTGIRQYSALARPKLYPAAEFFQRVDLEGFSAQSEDLPSGRWETFNHVSGQVYFGGASSVKLKYSRATEIFVGERFDTGGFHAMAVTQPVRQLYAGVLYRRIGAVNYDPGDPFQGWSNRWSADLIYQPTDQLSLYLSYIRFDFHRDSDDRELYEYPIEHARLTYQLNRYLFFRAIVEHNDYKDELLTDLLASFTYIPGTVLHLGYGSLSDRARWDELAQQEMPDDSFQQRLRGVFVKASYLWRL